MSNTRPAAPELTFGIDIDATRACVWQALTDPDALKKWMLEGELEVISDWQEGKPLVLRCDMHGTRFENHGTVRVFRPLSLLEYDYWSSLSAPQVPDEPQNYTTIRFELEPLHPGTRLTIRIRDFADEVIYKHVEFYWRGTIHILKSFCETARTP